MNQPDLFEPEPQAAPPAAPDLWQNRRLLNRALNILREARRMPWAPDELAEQTARFPALAAELPVWERQRFCAAFDMHVRRLAETPTPN